MEKDKKTTKPSEPKAKVHPDLEGFDIKINSFGEIVRSHSIDQINGFLNKKVVDKKLKERDGFLPGDGAAKNRSKGSQ